MDKFKKVTEPIEMQFYTIENGENGKNVHLMGYIYDSNFNNGHGTWRLEEPCFIIVPIADFIKGVRELEDYLDSLLVNAKQYAEDMEDDDVIECINEYFNGKPADYRLPYSEITKDTPCGNYVTY